MKGHAIILILVCLQLLFCSCTHEPLGIEDMEPVCFDTLVFPLLQASCGMTGCHGSGDAEEGFDVSDYDKIIQAVNPGKPKSSLLYKVITDISGENMMPPQLPLSQEQRSIIEIWIAQGALPVTCGDGAGISEVCFVQDILPMMLSSCGTTNCHDAVSHEDGYVLIDYNTITQRGIRPYDPLDSKIYEVVLETGDDRMPPSPLPPLSKDQISDLRKWIEKGALNTDCPSAVCDTLNAISFSAQVNPVLQSNCTGCHNSALAGGGVNLTGYANVLPYATQLRNGIPVLTGVIRKLPGFQPMPTTYSLDNCMIREIELWIDQGALNN